MRIGIHSRPKGMKKKQYINELLDDIVTIKEANEKLAERVERLFMENQELITENTQLKQQLSQKNSV